MKKIILALATLGTTFSFIACGDDSSSSVVESSSSTPIEDPDSKSDDLLSCDRTFKTTVEGVTTIKHMCGETSYSPEKEKNMECSSEGPLTAIKGTGCPSGEKKICENKEQGVVFYVYDEESADKSCEELMKETIVIEDPDSKSEGILSCDQKLKKTIDGETSTLHACSEVSYTDEIKELWDEVCPSEGPYDAIQGTGCPSGEKMICKNSEAGFDIVWYIYDEDAAKKSCEELMAENWGDGSDEDDENSDDEEDSSDSESDNLLSCDRTFETIVDGVTFVRHICAESSYSSEKEDLMASACVPFDATETAIKGIGCSSGEKKVCKGEEAGFDVVYYVYDEYSASKSCEDLLTEEFEIGSDKTFEGGDE